MRLAYRPDPQLAAFVKGLERTASGDWKTPVSEHVAAEAEQLVEAQFATGRGPSGSPWAPRKPPTGSWPLLVKTRAMAGSVSARPSASGLGADVTIADAKAAWHQNGTPRMVARQMFPGPGGSRKWSEAIRLVAGAALARFLRSVLP